LVTSNISRTIRTVAALAFFALSPARALAHCDGLDGPVVKAAQRALETRNPAFALIWVQEKDEREIQTVFERTLAVRELSPQAKELADRFFFETLVRVHRAGEGAPFTGLKPAGRDLGPAVPAADEAIRVGSVEPVLQLLTRAVQAGLREHFAEAMATKTFKSNDLAAGRAHVKAYVEFMHFVERLYESTMNAPHGHFDESEAPPKRSTETRLSRALCDHLSPEKRRHAEWPRQR
jgi:hypothetical protein